jgi:hypothetical protein
MKKDESENFSVNSSSSISPLQEFEGFTIRNINLLVEEERKNLLEKESEYFTVKFKYTMTYREKCLLLETIINSIVRKEYQVLNLAEYMIIEFLADKVSFLPEAAVRSKSYEEIRKKVSNLLDISYTILHNLPLSTRIEKKKTLPPEIFKDLLSLMEEKDILMTDREYGSRVDKYFPGKLLEFTVEMPLNSNPRGIPYSSYTKGYGESGHKKTSTPQDWEIDGEDIYGEKDFGSIILPQIYKLPRTISPKVDV